MSEDFTTFPLALSKSSAIPPYFEKPVLKARAHRLNLIPTAQSVTFNISKSRLDEVIPTSRSDEAFPNSRPGDVPRPSPNRTPSFSSTQHLRYELPPSKLPQFGSRSCQSSNSHFPIHGGPSSLDRLDGIGCRTYQTPHHYPMEVRNFEHSPNHSVESFSSFSFPYDELYSGHRRFPLRRDDGKSLRHHNSNELPSRSITDLFNPHLSQARLAGIKPSDLYFRPVEPKDFDDLQQLHKEWFPIA